jgi:hypothetical protein
MLLTDEKISRRLVVISEQATTPTTTATDGDPNVSSSVYPPPSPFAKLPRPAVCPPNFFVMLMKLEKSEKRQKAERELSAG